MIAMIEDGVGVAVGFADADDFRRYIEHLQSLCDAGERVVTLTRLPGDDERVLSLVRRCEKRLDQVYETEEGP